MKLTYLNPPDLPDWSSFFSQVVVGEGAALRVVFTSGQVGVDSQQAVPDGGFAAQVERAFANLLTALSAAGCTAADVAKLTIYVVGYEHSKAGIIQDAVRQHFGVEHLPACTLVGVQALGRPEFQIEVEAFAISTKDA